MRLVLQSTALAFSLLASLATTAAPANNASPVGLWQNIDDVSGKPRALIRITESNGTLRGTIEKVFLTPSDDPNPKCTKCEGNLKDVPVIGLTILTGLRKDGEGYSGGKILDADSGKVYSSSAKLMDGGSKLSVRGYIGVQALGRSQIWLRRE